MTAYLRTTGGEPRLVLLMKTQSWLIAESEFSNREPGVILLRAQDGGYKMESAWGGANVPFKTPPSIRDRARAQLQLAEQGDSLASERNDVLLAHLHAIGRNPPLAILQVELLPLGAAQFTRTHEHQRQQLQRVLRHWLTLIAVNGPHQRADLRGLRDGGMVANDDGRECAT